jgi:hypothetical protein
MFLACPESAYGGSNGNDDIRIIATDAVLSVVEGAHRGHRDWIDSGYWFLDSYHPYGSKAIARRVGLAPPKTILSNEKGPAVFQSAGPTTILGVLFLSFLKMFPILIFMVH